MRQHLSAALIAACILVGTPALARADVLAVDGAGRTVAEDCAGRDVTIDGAGHTVDLTGTCGNVEINGAGQTVNLEAVARVEVNGTDNRVTYVRGVKGKKKPKIARSGARNTVKRRKP